MTTYSDPYAVDNLTLPVGSGLEILTVDENGQVNGTALVKVTLPYEVSHEGRFFEGEFAGASAMTALQRFVTLESQLETATPGYGILWHLCRARRDLCGCQMPARGVWHIDCGRVRDPNAVTEPWVRAGVFGRPAAASDTAAPGPADAARGRALPWMADAAADTSRVSMLRERFVEHRDRGRESGRTDPQHRLALAAVEHRERQRARSRSRSRKRRRRKRSPSSDSTRDDDRDHSALAVFRSASSRDSSSDVRAWAAQHPGQLFMAGVTEVQRLLGAREGAIGDARGTTLEPKFVPYLLTVLHSQHPVEKVGVARSRELRTLAQCLDHLAMGQVAECADTLMQRFKACEAAAGDGTWNLAKRYELIPDVGSGLVGVSEKKQAAKDEVLAQRLSDAAGRKKNATKSGTE